MDGTQIDAGQAKRAGELTWIPDHQLLCLIGKGSYGQVWLTRNATGTLRAVKIVYRASFKQDRPYQREFEGVLHFEPISRMHEGLVDILQVGRNDEQHYFYYVMELADAHNADAHASERSTLSPANKSSPQLVEDQSLPDDSDYHPLTLERRIRQEGRLPVGACVTIALSLAKALQYLHETGLVHRDVKPSNIIFAQGVPKLADVGLVAKAENGGSFVGTEGFVPPEGPGSVQADIFSLGKVIYEMAMGKDRLAFPSLPGFLEVSPERQQLLGLNEIILKACHSDPARRYCSALECIHDLEALTRGESLYDQRQRRMRVRVLVSAGLAFFMLAGVCLLVWAPHPPHKPSAQQLEVDPDLHKASAQQLKVDPENVFDRVALLKQVLRQRPELWIPEIQYLNASDWLEIAEGNWRVRVEGEKALGFSSEEDLRRALSEVRQRAKTRFAYRLGGALNKYVWARRGHLPAKISDLKSNLDKADISFDNLNSPAQEDLFQRYRMVRVGNIKDQTNELLIAEIAPVDPEFDTLFQFGLTNCLVSGVGRLSSVTNVYNLRRPL